MPRPVGHPRSTPQRSEAALDASGLGVGGLTFQPNKGPPPTCPVGNARAIKGVQVPTEHLVGETARNHKMLW